MVVEAVKIGAIAFGVSAVIGVTAAGARMVGMTAGLSDGLSNFVGGSLFAVAITTTALILRTGLRNLRDDRDEAQKERDRTLAESRASGERMSVQLTAAQHEIVRLQERVSRLTEHLLRLSTEWAWERNQLLGLLSRSGVDSSEIESFRWPGNFDDDPDRTVDDPAEN